MAEIELVPRRDVFLVEPKLIESEEGVMAVPVEPCLQNDADRSAHASGNASAKRVRRQRGSLRNVDAQMAFAGARCELKLPLGRGDVARDAERAKSDDQEKSRAHRSPFVL